MGKVTKNITEENINKPIIKMSRSGRQIKLPQKMSFDEEPLIKKPRQSQSTSDSNSQFVISKDPLILPMKANSFNKSNTELIDKQNLLKTSLTPSHEHAEMFDFVDLELFQKSNEKVDDESFKNRVLDTLDILREQNKRILAQQELILKELAKTNNNTDKKLSESFLTPLRGFPIETIEKFNEFESEIGRESRTKVYNHLVNMGGATLRNFLSNSIRRLLTDNLVCSFTWNGGDNTIKFGDTKTANVLYQAATRCENFDGPSNKENFKHHMLEVLRHTKQRHRKLLKKNLQPMKISKDHDNILKYALETFETGHNGNDNNDDDDDDDDGDDDDNDRGDENFDCVEEEIYDIKEGVFLEA